MATMMYQPLGLRRLTVGNTPKRLTENEAGLGSDANAALPDAACRAILTAETQDIRISDTVAARVAGTNPLSPTWGALRPKNVPFVYEGDLDQLTICTASAGNNATVTVELYGVKLQQEAR
jgi:hypothetical protein